MFIQTEITPNPATIKFLPGQKLIENGPIDCPDADTAAARSPLAERLFLLDGVAGVLISEDSVAVTKSEDTSWEVLKLQVMGLLVEHLSGGHRVVHDEASLPKSSTVDDGSIESKIKILIETRVRPVVARDGGDIAFESFENGIVYLRMKGACAGCPSATMTLKNGVENMLKVYVPEVIAVKQCH